MKKKQIQEKYLCFNTVNLNQIDLSCLYNTRRLHNEIKNQT